MQFKIKDVRVIVSFTFFALILFLVIFRKNELIILTCFFAIFHELGHLIALKNFGVIIYEFKISFFGAKIKTGNLCKLKSIEKISILLAGPFVNLIFFIIFFALSYFVGNDIHTNIYLINLFLLVFNILPFYNFDGGKILEALLSTKFNKKVSDALITIISFCVLIPITLFSICIFLSNNDDFYYLIVSGLMLLTIILKK